MRQVTAEVDELQLAPASLDAALFVMSYHDAYWRPADGSWNRTDPDEMLRRLYVALKPGGVVVVQDHVARPGGDTAKVVDELHRIDPAVVRSAFERAGFDFDGASEMLAHPADDHTKLVFDESIRGKTDQFIYRFRKPTTVRCAARQRPRLKQGQEWQPQRVTACCGSRCGRGRATSRRRSCARGATATTRSSSTSRSTPTTCR